ncbi:MAG: tetratricopeptide repeat protein [bacterium]
MRVARLVLSAFALGLAAPLGAARPQEARAALAEARSALEREQPRRALRLARKVLDQDPEPAQAVDAWLVVIDALADSGRYSRVVEECEKLLDTYPATGQRSAVLRREFEGAKALAASYARVLFLRFPRLEEGVAALEKVIERAPFGPLADDAILAIADAYYQAGHYETARDHCDRLLKHYPDSELASQARKRRVLCNLRLTRGGAYNAAHAEQAGRDLERLARDGQPLEEPSQRVCEVMAERQYEAGLFYFREGNIEGGLRYLESLIVNHPSSHYARRARRLLEEGIIAKFPHTEYADRARQFLAAHRPGTSEETP